MYGNGIAHRSIVDWHDLQNFKKTFTSDISKKTEEDFKDRNITMFEASPKFVGPNELVVGDYKISAKKIVIATGLVPHQIDVKGSKHLNQSDDFLSLKKLPKRIVFIGAGYIGMEFAQIAARAGKKVTIIDHGERLLKTFDSDLAQLIERVSINLGIKFIYNSKLQSLKKTKSVFKIKYAIHGKKNR